MTGLAWKLLAHLRDAATTEDWRTVLQEFTRLGPPSVSLHLAVLVEPYLEFILDGLKTVESRFSIRPIPPYRRVEPQDVVLLKASGGPVVGAFTVSAVWHYRLDPASWSEVRRDFAAALCAQSGFWDERATAEYATLLRISDVRRLAPVILPKKDRRGWVILADRSKGGRLL